MSSLIRSDQFYKKDLLFRCDAYPNSIGFPTERKNEANNFVAGCSDGNYLWKKCPRKCRREGHVDDWEYC